MPNTNFQTFHQMGAAINDLVKQATGRENVQNIDMEHVTVAQNRHYVEVEVSGSMVSFNAGAAGLPLEKCLVQIKPVQEGSGDPSPENVRPISGWDGVRVFVSPTTDAADGQTYTIAFPSESGIVGAGTLDVVGGKLVVNEIISTVSNLQAYDFKTGSYTVCKRFTLSPGSNAVQYNQRHGAIASFGVENAAYYGSLRINDPGSVEVDFAITSDGGILAIYNADLSLTSETFMEKYGNQQICYPLASPIEYTLTPTEIRTLLGLNNIWSDAGDITVKFKDLKELY